MHDHIIGLENQCNNTHNSAYMPHHLTIQGMVQGKEPLIAQENIHFLQKKGKDPLTQTK